MESRDSDAGDRSESNTDDDETVRVTVCHENGDSVLVAPLGGNLRVLLLANGFSPYTALTERLNCGGRGLCATCGVRLEDGTETTHWHDALAERFGYPRLSCQISVESDLTVSMVEDKLIWGGRT
jgi:ferredoxin